MNTNVQLHPELTIQCPRCGAQPGNPCFRQANPLYTPNAVVWIPSHVARKQEAALRMPLGGGAGR